MLSPTLSLLIIPNMEDDLSLCLPIISRGLFDKEKIAKLKKGVLIVNNARGAIMDTQAVVDACSSGHIAGNIIKTNP